MVGSNSHLLQFVKVANGLAYFNWRGTKVLRHWPLVKKSLWLWESWTPTYTQQKW